MTHRHTALALAAGNACVLAAAVSLVALLPDQAIDVARTGLLLARPFAPYSTAAVAFFGGIIAWRSYVHRRNSDYRAEWWRRVQHALEMATVDEDRLGRETGLRLLVRLVEDESATEADAALLYEISQSLISEKRAAMAGAARGHRAPGTRWRRR